MRRCEWCGTEFADPSRTGRPRKYCRRSHRQRHYEARRRGADRGLADHEAIVNRTDYDRLRDEIYRLEAACEDADTDLHASPTRTDLSDVIDALTSVARGVIEAVVEPSATGD